MDENNNEIEYAEVSRGFLTLVATSLESLLDAAETEGEKYIIKILVNSLAEILEFEAPEEIKEEIKEVEE